MKAIKYVSEIHLRQIKSYPVSESSWTCIYSIYIWIIISLIIHVFHILMLNFIKCSPVPVQKRLGTFLFMCSWIFGYQIIQILWMCSLNSFNSCYRFCEVLEKTHSICACLHHTITPYLSAAAFKLPVYLLIRSSISKVFFFIVAVVVVHIWYLVRPLISLSCSQNQSGNFVVRCIVVLEL